MGKEMRLRGRNTINISFRNSNKFQFKKNKYVKLNACIGHETTIKVVLYLFTVLITNK